VSLLIRNGRVVDPATGTDSILDVLIEGRRIARVGRGLAASGAPTIDATGLIVAPGFIDMHVHLREPGQTAKETIATGARAAARGGFTTICAMPNTSPVNDEPDVTRWILALAASAAVHVLPVAALTLGSVGEALTDMAGLAAAGAAAFSDDGRCIQKARLMRLALETARDLGLLVSDHCEDRSLFEGGVMHEGAVSARLGWPGIPAEAEDLMVARDIILAEGLGAGVHIAHLSTKGAAELVRAGKARGVRVSAEVTPHHLVLTDEVVADTRDPNTKVNPPLRSRDHVEALLAAVADGTIDVFATDHAPHTAAEKALDFAAAPFGMVGLETAVPVLLDRLVRPGLVPLDLFVRMCSTRPAELLRLPDKGRIAAGADADLTLLDLQAERTVRSSDFASKARNTPFEGWTLRGAPAMTIVAGEFAYPFARG
jgi:dihydroorotase